MKRGEVKKYPSLYEMFELGDRVKRIYKDGDGIKEYKGIVLSIKNDCIEVYWDTMNGKYRPPSMNIAFTTCSIDEILKGNERYSPIIKEK